MQITNTCSWQKKSAIFIFLFIAALSTTISAQNGDQRFKGSVVFGLNLAQIDGDNLAGFSKLGLTGGVKLAYPIKEHSDVTLELLYSQRGSTSGFGFGSLSDIYTDLKYLEIPVYVNIMDWWIQDEGYHKVKAHGGLNYSYLFDVESSNGAISNNIENYKRNDLGFLVGVDYMFTKNFGTTVRYTRSFTSITDVRAISYFVTVRTEYMF